jgi:hypothetical protein
MERHVVRGETPLEFFKEQVEGACERQGLHVHPDTTYYVVTLLDAFTHLESSRAGEALASNEALGLRLIRALQSGGRDQRIGLKQVGDVSLFISGFFSDSLRRSPVDMDYYMSLGGYAYGSLGRNEEGPLAETFEELSHKFVSFVDVLAEISERSGLTTNADLLRLYERWLRTGSRRNGDLLIERGLIPPTGGSRRVQ